MLLSGRLKTKPHSHADNGNPQSVVRNALFQPLSVKEISVKPAPAKSLFPCFLPSYGEAVKAKNEKQRMRALRVRVGG